MSRPIVDAKGRRRCKTIAFRMSPAEADQLDLRVALSGLSKQEFIARSLLEGTFTVVATTRMRKAVKERMGPVVAELRRIRRAGDMDDELVEVTPKSVRMRKRILNAIERKKANVRAGLVNK